MHIPSTGFSLIEVLVAWFLLTMMTFSLFTFQNEMFAIGI